MRTRIRNLLLALFVFGGFVALLPIVIGRSESDVASSAQATGVSLPLAMVGLGKTIQLAMAAMLMALWGDKPVLIIAPKPLLWQ